MNPSNMAIVFLTLLLGNPVLAEDWPMFGRDRTRIIAAENTLYAITGNEKKTAN